MYPDSAIRGNNQFQRSAVIAPGATVILIEDTDFGRACKVAVTGLATYSNDDASFVDVVYSVVLDGIPHKEYGAFQDAIGAIDKLRDMPRGFIEANQKLQITATHTNASGLSNTYKVGAIVGVDYVVNN